MVKSDVKPNKDDSMRRMRLKMLWKVPIHKAEAQSAPTVREMRSFISRAALLVNVRARMLHGL